MPIAPEITDRQLTSMRRPREKARAAARVFVSIDPDVETQARVKAARERISLSQAYELGIVLWLQSE